MSDPLQSHLAKIAGDATAPTVIFTCLMFPHLRDFLTISALLVEKIEKLYTRHTIILQTRQIEALAGKFVFSSGVYFAVAVLLRPNSPLIL